MALLAACQGRGERDAFVDSRPPPGLAERFYPPEGWGWGLIAADGGPMQRYGVAAGAGAAKGQVLILPDYGETVETWFETARDLSAAGYTVWILEGVGQGGSERIASPRDLGELRSFAIDRIAVQAMAGQLIPQRPDQPLVFLGQGVGAYVGARAVEQGARPAGIILSGATCERPTGGALLRGLGFGGLRAPGTESWRRDGPDDFAARRTHDPWRGAVTHAWQGVNPDLRMGGPSLDWQAAYAELQDHTLADLDKLNAPVTILQTRGPQLCIAVPGADTVVLAADEPAPELETDARRGPWLAAVEAALARMTQAAKDRSAAAHAP